MPLTACGDACTPLIAQWKWNIASAQAELQCPTDQATAIPNRTQNLPYNMLTFQTTTTLSTWPDSVNGKPVPPINGPSRQSCSPLDAQDKVNIVVQDDELFVSNHALDMRDVADMPMVFHDAVWDSTNGRLNIDVTDRYYTSPQEKTLAYYGVGTCPDTDAIWESAENNPMADANTDVFGSCDFLKDSYFANYTTLASVFEAMYGESSYQPNSAHYAIGNGLFGGDVTAAANSAGKNNVLFMAPNPLNADAQWTTSRFNMTDAASADNVDLRPEGVRVTFSATIEQLQKCTLPTVGASNTGGFAVKTSVDSAGNTMYTFNMSATHVTAKRKGDSTHHFYSSSCSHRQYTLTVGNTLMAMSGIKTEGGSSTSDSHVYVDEMGYSTQVGVCSATGACRPDLGPKHACSNSTPATDLRAFEYKVNLDMRVYSQLTAAGMINKYIAVSDHGSDYQTDVVVNSDNCYGAAPVSVSNGWGKKRGANDAIVDDQSVVRSVLTFRTACRRTHKACLRLTSFRGAQTIVLATQTFLLKSGCGNAQLLPSLESALMPTQAAGRRAPVCQTGFKCLWPWPLSSRSPTTQ